MDATRGIPFPGEPRGHDPLEALCETPPGVRSARLVPAGLLWSRVRSGALGVFILAGAAIAIDALLVEPYWIEVRRSVEYLPALRAGVPDLTVVHVSDLHIRGLGSRERHAIDRINASRPDLILISGDLTGRGCRPGDLQTFLGALRSRHGKFLVWGNHDYHGEAPAAAWGPSAVRRGGFTLLNNESRAVGVPGARLRIAGLDDPVTGRDSLRAAMSRVSRRDLCILLSHSPEIVRSLGNWDVDMVFAGHTHGGQIRLPGIGPLWVPYGTRDYVEGWFTVQGSARLHVSQGLGWSYVPARLLCRPRIDVITLRGGLPPGTRVRRVAGGRS
jgi:hypothetical protein